MLKIYNNYDNNKLDFYVIIFFVKNKLDEDFIKSLVVIASGICRGNDPYELVNGAFEYLKKNWDKYEEHPNLKAIAVLKMKGLFIDEIRKKRNLDTYNKDYSSEFNFRCQNNFDRQKSVNNHHFNKQLEKAEKKRS